MNLTDGEVKKLFMMAQQLLVSLNTHLGKEIDCGTCERRREQVRNYLTSIQRKVYTPSSRSNN